MNEIQKERLIELLTDETLFGLNEAESTELDRLKKQFPEWENNISFELAAVAVSLTDLDVSEPLPADLRAKVLADADEFFNQSEKVRNVVSFPTKAKETVGATVFGAVENTTGIETKQPFWQWLGWGVAFAACAALAVNLWLTDSRPPTEIVREVKTVETPTPEPSLTQKRESLLATAPDVIKAEITKADPKAANDISGDIVWSNSRQAGFVRFRGLPVNDTSKETYQLWVVDETYDEKYPINGGVFDVGGGGEIIVPINAELKIKKPKLFAVSKEKPGGVVVSSPQRLVAVAKI
ncbi:MAG TPA: anti-sigma factor [Pyrinomonadaceae bacterium]|nr:anti-sigma factor [Pyrinomonadaceae bacterium]